MTYPIKRLGFFLLCDAVLSFVSFFSAYLLRFNFQIPESFFVGLWSFFALICLLKLSFFLIFGVYQIPWRFFSLDGLQKLAWAHIAAYGIFVGFIFFAYYAPFITLPQFPKSIPFIDGALSIILIGFLRVSKRVVLDAKLTRKIAENIAIVGAEDEAERFFRSLDRSKYNARFFIDDDPSKKRLRIHNLPIVSFSAAAEFARKFSVSSAVVAPEEKNPPIKTIYELLSAAGIKKISIARSAIGEGAELHSLKIEDLLARNPKDLDKAAIANFIKNKRVLITGAGGSIGGELSRMCERYGAKELILVDSSEFNLYQVGQELPNATLKMVNITDREATEKLFIEIKPQIVIHAAAYKHVPLVEANPIAAVINNIFGTKNCIDLSVENGAETFVLISTDKAVRPTSVMGATKRVCELYLQNLPPRSTRLVAVRFGNVLGSSGSVVPLFRRQIAENRPLTVTHPEMTRYFMLISEAAELVLQAATLAKGGEIFVLDMGAPVKIADMARKMLELSGKTDLGVVFVGLRAGEKLYEELLIETGDRATKYPSIFVGGRTDCDIAALAEQIAKLPFANDIPSALKAIVPEFNHNQGGNSGVNLPRV